MSFSYTAGGQSFVFDCLKQVLAKANEEKSGDRLAGLAANSELERIAAKLVLSGVTLKELRAEPVASYEEDAVTRFIDSHLNNEVFNAIASWTVADLREFLLSDKVDSSELNRIRPALTGEMAPLLLLS